MTVFEFFGYEWGFECPNCEAFNDLSGMALAGPHPTVNGEENAIRTRSLPLPADLECGECGEEWTIQAVKE